MSDLWWKDGVIYQVYPRSFQDSNSDGIGDLRGIINRLDYLNDGTDKSLGVSAIWLSPIYPSPMADFGYDVSDYCDVHPNFGDLATLDELVAKAGERGIRVILDFVPNHSSNEHAWFQESRSSRDNPKRDWYVWRDPRPDGSPPNNWIAVFGGPAWQWDQATMQYYLHEFLVEQPDLNWRNPQVEQAMHHVLRFWLERGIAGFRIDVMDRIVKDPELRDNPGEPNREWARRMGQTALQRHVYDQNWPDIIDYTRRIRATVDAYPERYTIGEVFGTPENVVRYYGGETADGLHQAFNFPLVRMTARHWDARWVRRHVDAFEAALPKNAWPNWVTGNHDVDRLRSRLGGGEEGHRKARLIAMLLLTLRGTPYVYYGEELGMENVHVPPEEMHDPARFYARGRDPERTPMQWSAAGDFTSGRPWLPYGDLRINAADQAKEERSTLSLYRRLIHARKTSAALRKGDYEPVDDVPEGVFAFTRTHDDDRTLTVLNFSEDEVPLSLASSLRLREPIAWTDEPRSSDGNMRLTPSEGRVYTLG